MNKRKEGMQENARSAKAKRSSAVFTF